MFPQKIFLISEFGDRRKVRAVFRVESQYLKVVTGINSMPVLVRRFVPYL
jgi:hypothetical protein